jgi:4-aminobutyrate aminotransferase
VKPKVSARLPGPKAKRIVSDVKKHCVPGTFIYPLAIKDGKGSYIQDVDGNWFLDFTTQVCSSPLGYGHPSIMRVMKECSCKAAHKIAGQDAYSEEHAALAKKLVQITPSHMKKLFMSNTGAEAVENAIKFAYRKKGPMTGVSCFGAFHGRTLGALTYTFSKPVQKRNYPQLAHKRIKFCTSDKDRHINDIFRAARKGSTAFIMVEAIQGEGGYNIASRKFLRNLQKAAKDAGAALILDEVQAGMGRTGKWWGFEHFSIKPDIMSTAKALQVGATVSSEKWATKEAGAVSSTWGGGARIDMAMGLETIKIIQKEKLMLNARKLGASMLKRLKRFDDYPGVAESGGLGLMLKLDFASKARRDSVVQKAFRSGLLLLPCGMKAIRIVPPLNITREDAELGLDMLENILKKG